MEIPDKVRENLMQEYKKWWKSTWGDSPVVGIPEDTRTKEEKQKQWIKTYYDNNRETVLAKGRLYNETHREQIAERNRRYRETHKDEISERAKAYRENLKDERKEYSKTYYDQHKEYYAEKQKIKRTLQKECEVCGCSVVKADFTNHLKTKKHREAIK